MRFGVLAALSLLAILMFVGGPVIAEDPPRLLATNPVDGSQGVPTRLGGVVFVFDRAMSVDSQSLVLSERGEFPPISGTGEWMNERTFFLRVKDLVAGKTYAMGLNNARHRGFRSADGSPLAPTSMTFTVGEAGPVILGTEPNIGATGIDPATDRIVVHFSEAVKAGPMSLVRVANTTPLPYVADRKPYLENPKTLIIPVALAGNTTYGVGVNGPSRSAFVTAAAGKPYLPMNLVFTTGPAKAAPPATGLTGQWQARSEEGEIGLLLNADGTYRYAARSPEGMESARGTWRVEGDKLRITEEGAGEPLLVPFRQEGADHLAIQIDGAWIRLTRADGTKEPDAAPAAPALPGRWHMKSGADEMFLLLGTDGRYVYRARSAEGSESASGTWSAEEATLIISEEGAAEPLRVPFKLIDSATLEIRIEGQTVRLSRVAEDRKPAPEEAPRRGQEREPAKFGPSGSILFIRYDSRSVNVAGRQQDITLPKLYCMEPDGSGAWKVWTVNDDISVENPWWSPDSTSWLCASNAAHWESALYTDIWLAPRAEKGIRRITGNSRAPTAVHGTGEIAYLLTDDTGKGIESVHWNWQGATGTTKTGSKLGAGLVQDVPAGKLWIKCWFSKHIGDLAIIDVPVGGQAQVELKLTRGNRLATYPSITPDGRHIVCLSQHAWYDPGKNPPEQGFDTMAVVDAETGQVAALWEPTKNGGAFAKDPRLSPDGKSIAFAMGLAGMESLAVCSLESFLAGRPDTRVLVPGNRVLGHGTVGNVSPAWSPDGKHIVFSRYFMSTAIKGNLFVVSAAGGAPVQVTQLAQNQCPTYPSWSPSGTHIAFQLITSRSRVLDILDLIRINFVSDICTMRRDGGELKKITTDGRSGQPAWGL
jgi:WD40-like Beta Propeller Repeat